MGDLATWMRAAGEDDDSLAEKLGVSRVQVSRLRRKVCKPSPETAERLERLTHIPAWDFVKPAPDKQRAA